MPAPAPDLDLPRLLAVAGEILDGAVPTFADGLGAPSAVAKGGWDFATEIDLALERRIGGELLARTGIPVHGEEFGGPPVTEGVVWVLDPVDGTYNYSSGMPLAAMLLALVVDGEPVLGLTWLPLLGLRLAGHCAGPLLVNGTPAPPLTAAPLNEAAVGFGAFNVRSGGRWPGPARAQLLGELSYRARRTRMTGSTGVDLAWAATGAFGAAVAFGAHAWDLAAGAALIRAAGGEATDLFGNRWTAGTPSLVAGNPQAHAELLALAARCDWHVKPERKKRT